MFGVLKKRGAISKETAEEFAEATPDIGKLPEHAGGVKRKKKSRRMAGKMAGEK
jgi:hypothetical protein